MSVSLFKIKKWFNMLRGKSLYHVNQTAGLCYSVDKVEGYYNNLTEKVTRFPYPNNQIPITQDDDGSKREFSIAIFQYGLAAYDLMLMHIDEANSEKKFMNCVNWAMEHQEESGAWLAMESVNPVEPYSAMAQGEGASLLVRAYLKYGDEKYLKAAGKAVKFMLTPINNGGVAEYAADGGIRLHEYTYMPLVLNGWIFAAWGLLDYAKVTGDGEIMKSWELTTKTMADELKLFDAGYWSKYTVGKTMASPFYHNLHIAQLNVMADLTGIVAFKEYADKFSDYGSSWLNGKRAFIKKAIQKITE